MLLIFLTACGTTQVWTKPNATDQEFAKDNLECRIMAERNSNGDRSLRNVYNNNCMISRGYKLQSSKYGLMP
jgi:hypothetical protein